MRRILIILCVSGLTGLTLPRCKSAPTKAETLQAMQNLDAIGTDADSIAQTVTASTASAEVKQAVKAQAATIKARAAETRRTVESQGLAIDRCNAEVQGLQDSIAALKIYRGLVWGFCACLGLAVLGFVVFKVFRLMHS
jgi:hypothetical protein